MIDQILANQSKSCFDFRSFAHPDDPLSHKFKEWVPYYQLKSAIAQAIRPKTILEIGVRYGYSAQAFLHGAPDAKYVGIDNDSDYFGGSKGALQWARDKFDPNQATFIKNDTQALDRLPGDSYDLIHVDGQQDGKGTYHDLELALGQGNWILVDGYFWTSNNFRETNEFLLRHRELFEYALTIPGYAGEFLIKTKPEYLESMHKIGNATSDETTSQHLIDCYDSSYYLKDCGGHESYLRNGPGRLEDPRLLSVLSLVALKDGGNILDLGCGRGEIAYQGAKHGFKAVGLDYSAEAIALAKDNLSEAPHLKNNLKYLVGNATNFQLKEQFDIVVASDIIEHLTPKEVESCYQCVADNLKHDGIFAIHTFPNLWHYKYHYARLRHRATKLGAFLPIEPRSRYEKLMHINEQNPRVLLRQLKKHFKHVLLWFGAPEDPAGSLIGRSTPERLAAYRDLFALASNTPIEPDTIRKLLAPHLHHPEEIKEGLELNIVDAPKTVGSNEKFNVQLQISNNTEFHIHSLLPQPVNASYHWQNLSSQNFITFDGMRTPLHIPIPPENSLKINLACEAPGEAGQFKLVCTLVQEHYAWFDQPGYDTSVHSVVNVKPNLHDS
jgi:SAM-dependent methyltransferase